MKRSSLTILVLTLAVGLLGGYALSGPAVGDGDVIVISPQTIAINSKATCVTVHTNLPFDLGKDLAWDLDGIPSYLVKSDDCGYLVAKFDSALVKAAVSPPEATLTLVGADGETVVFEASDTVRVKK